TGANVQIIAYSKYYRMALWFLIILVVLVGASMYLLIPVWGITGAAIAIALSFLVNNLLRFIFLYRKFSFQPFNSRFMIVVLAFASAYLAGILLPELPLFWDIFTKSAVFTMVYGGLIIAFKASPDVNFTLTGILQKLK